MKIKKLEEKQIALHKKKDMEIHAIKDEHFTIKNVSSLVTKNVSEQVDGGEDLRNAALVAYMASKPVASMASKGITFARKKIEKEKQSRKQRQDERKPKTKGDKQHKSSEKHGTKKDEKQSSNKKSNDNSSGKGKKKKLGLIQKAKLILPKANLNKQPKEASDRQESPQIVKDVAPWLALGGIGLLLASAVVVPVMAVIAIIYHSPFAIFMPPLEAGDTVQSVTSAYVSEFNLETSNYASSHEGYDMGEIVYVDYEGTMSAPSNYYDILAVYMVKHGVGEAATIMNDTTKQWLKDVFDDMCSYTLTSGTEVIESEDGNTESKSVLYVNIYLKDYQDMISEYGFDDNQTELVTAIMDSGNLTLLGYVSGGSLSSKLSASEINSILEGITDGKQKDTCSFALSKVGFPYSQQYRDSGTYYDCSSLAYYSWKSAGIDISYNGATTAAAEAQGLESAGYVVSYEEMQPGDLIFYSYLRNGRYKNISHVAIYIGNGKVVEAKNEEYGVVYGDIPSPENIVLIGRPQ